MRSEPVAARRRPVSRSAAVLAGPARARRARQRARARRAAAGRRRGRARHDRAHDRRGGRAGRRARPRTRPGLSGPPDGDRLPRIAIVGFPNVGKSTLVNRLSRRPRGGRPQAGRGHPRPQGARVRMERGPLRADRHRRASTSPPRTRSPARFRTRRGRRSPTPTRSRWCSTPVPACDRATPRSPRSCAAPSCRSSSSPTRSTRRPKSHSRPTSTRSASASRLPSRPRTVAAPATCSIAWPTFARDRGSRSSRRTRSGVNDCRHRPPERRQVVARQRLPRRRPGDRLRARGDDPRRDRHRRSSSTAGP